MDSLSVKVPDELLADVEAYADAAHDGNRSEAARELLRRGLDADAIETENERLQNHLQQLIAQREEHTELVEFVAEEKALQDDRRERQRAPVWRRAKWWVLGTPGEKD